MTDEHNESSTVNTVMVRLGTLDDAAGVGKVHADAWQEAYGELFEPEVLARAVDHRRHMWSTMMTRPSFAQSTLLVAEAQDGVVGFATFGVSDHDPDQGEVYGFYVHPDYWGTGVAQKLMSAVRDALIRRGLLITCLWTLPGSFRARRFYEKVGFTATGRTKDDDIGGGIVVNQMEYLRLP